MTKHFMFLPWNYKGHVLLTAFNKCVWLVTSCLEVTVGNKMSRSK